MNESTFLTLQNEKSDKWYRVTIDGCAIIKEYGRTGSAGQKISLQFGTTAKARQEYNSIIAAKRSKGYNTGFEKPPTEEQISASVSSLQALIGAL